MFNNVDLTIGASTIQHTNYMVHSPVIHSEKVLCSCSVVSCSVVYSQHSTIDFPPLFKQAAFQNSRGRYIELM